MRSCIHLFQMLETMKRTGLSSECDWHADANEKIEVLFPSTVAAASLSLVLYNGNDPSAAVTVGNPTTLSGAVPIGATGFSAAVASYAANGIQNGPNDGVALVCGGSVIQLLSWEGVLTASNGPAAGQSSTDIGVAEDGACRPTMHGVNAALHAGGFHPLCQ